MARTETADTAESRRKSRKAWTAPEPESDMSSPACARYSAE